MATTKKKTTTKKTEKKVKKLDKKAEGIVGGIKEKLQDIAEELVEEKSAPVKKKEVKMLSEKELKKAMTDTKATLVPLTDYIRCSTHLGTKVITPDMRRYVYKRRADGLAVINTNLIDDKLRKAIEVLNKHDVEDIFIACKREAGWPAVDKFAEVTGIRAFTKKYPAGIITNLDLDDFFEAKLVFICDPWVDKNALNDANRLGLEVLSICDTNNYTKGVSTKIIGNNKARKSLGLILFILAREYLKSKGMDKEAKALKMEDFTGKLEIK
jgi:small subunit ribosomal protein S2